MKGVELTHARVVETLSKLRLGHIAERLDMHLSEAAREDITYLDLLDRMLEAEVGSKQRKRAAMGIQIAHFPALKTLDEFDFRFQPSVDAKLVRELATGRFIPNGENMLVFGPPGVGKTDLAIGLGRACVEVGHSVLFTGATALLASLAKAESEGQIADKLSYYAKPKLLITGELGYLPFERRSAPVLPARRAPLRARQHADHDEPGGHAVGPRLRRRRARRRAVLDRLLHHSHTLVITGESHRVKQKKKAGLLSGTTTAK